jgi:hypothetical protein
MPPLELTQVCFRGSRHSERRRWARRSRAQMELPGGSFRPAGSQLGSRFRGAERTARPHSGEGCLGTVQHGIWETINVLRNEANFAERATGSACGRGVHPTAFYYYLRNESLDRHSAVTPGDKNWRGAEHSQPFGVVLAIPSRDYFRKKPI